MLFKIWFEFKIEKIEYSKNMNMKNAVKKIAQCKTHWDRSSISKSN